MSEEPRQERRTLFGYRPASTVAERTERTERTDKDADHPVAKPLRVAAAYGWRLLILAAVLALLIWFIAEFKTLVIPVVVAVLLTALLWPFFSWLRRMRVPTAVAIIVSLLGTISIVAGLVWLSVWQIANQAADVRDRAVEGWYEIEAWVVNLGLLPDDVISQAVAFVTEFVQEQAQVLLSGALTVGLTVGHIVAGILLTLFTLICFLADGKGIWGWTTTLFPKKARAAVDGAARNGWSTLVNYARTQILVALIDAVGIGVGAALLGVPLAIPIGVIVFLASFIPFLGAILTGILAVFIALAYNGIWTAIAMLGVVLLVQQIESQVLQPLIMSAAVKVHPLAVVLVVLAGAAVGGIAGALFAVPFAAFVNVVAVTLSTGSWRTGELPDTDLIWRTEPKTIGRGSAEKEKK
ncbi:AI-2E family transporter [Microbacterium amylolyticum]|uniref:PurR-regulated permease PerM n=1 Tax=Microbacterium amylolyticum TaxID=936337 RepID=A0ABS4ZG45_9MICO|nr:AI-2E family transporter [Microbacterium amylolyticum]MBP2435960.1 putative PurR-regulated permease PerM [Microbacterium amylolyticum]